MDTTVYDQYVKTQPRCTCGVKLTGYSIINGITDQELYSQLKTCMDCDKNYVIKDEKAIRLTNAEFRRLFNKCFKK